MPENNKNELDYLSGQFDNIDFFDPDLSAYTGFNISTSPMSAIGKGISRYGSPNIFEDKELYTAIVLMPFKIPLKSLQDATYDTHGTAGSSGVQQACKAVIPGAHSCAANPFLIKDSSRRAHAISHFPTFVAEREDAEMLTPLVPGSIIEVSFDNPWSPWSGGTIKRVIKGRPTMMPEWSADIPGALSLFENWPLISQTLGGLSSMFGKISSFISGDPSKIAEELGLTHVHIASDRVNLVDGTETLHTWLKILNANAAAVNKHIYITSAVRTDADQSRIMFGNYVSHGGPGSAGARAYLKKLYTRMSKGSVDEVADAYDSIKSGVSKDQALATAARVINAKWSHSSGHLSAQGVDLTPYDKQTLGVIRATLNSTTADVLDEFDHFHCTIKSTSPTPNQQIKCFGNKYGKCISSPQYGGVS